MASTDTNYVYVRLLRPEGYEDVCNTLVIEDADISAAFKPEDFTDQVVASMQTADLNGGLAEDVQREIGRQRDVIRKSNEYADHLGMSLRDIKCERDELLNALHAVANALEWHEDRMPKGQESGALDLARAAIAKVKK